MQFATTSASSVRSTVEQSSRPLLSAIDRFAAWLEINGYESYDPYDLSGTRYGVFARRLYYRKHPLGKALVAPMLLLEMFCPGVRMALVRKQRFATADAQLALAFLNLYSVTRDARYLREARQLATDLLESSIPGYSGHCWGYPFDWENNHGLWKKNTPFITATPYCFEVFLGLFDATGDKSYFEIARSIAEFVHKDLHDTPKSEDAAAGSYSPNDHTEVLNASAYRAMVLFEAAARFGDDAYRLTAQKNLNFILQNQREDGAWLYALDHQSNRFIDHFHTCFVLKNLFKLNRRLRSDAVSASIRKGFDYYQRELFDERGLPKNFALEPRRQIVRLEMYNFAEAITLGALLQDEIPAAYELAQRLAHLLIEDYQLPQGYFVTRIYFGGFDHTLPFLRWPQAQLFYSLTNLLLTINPPRETQSAA